ncbi:adenosylcobinamide-GDP ribazoletransferase [uncultured Desulfobacter sp.]|uniref:adenosylcobinamide-GDP ribazoletransferase n=1 Tax=uncultured Desulfobacter sp. TaxID=240139 RepID=UPI002AAAF1F2|nr:adenosylcobinamide-GDP ribazoletransferase [uncultured Desulfobacter sp.]
MTPSGKSCFFKDLQACIAFITILPAGKKPVYSPLGMIRFFPLVGLIIGALLVVTDFLASKAWAPPVAALADLMFLVAVTGAFHLDGLGDTADGIFSHRGRERALEIMKDSRIGMMGLVTVVLGLAAKFAGIWSVKISCSPVQTMAIFFLVPSFSRASMIFGIKYLDYGRKDKGTGKDLFTRPLNAKDFYLCLIPLGFSLFLGYRGLILISGFALGCFTILKFYKRKMNCITGDMLGAMTEVMEAGLFMAAGMNIIF